MITELVCILHVTATPLFSNVKARSGYIPIDFTAVRRIRVMSAYSFCLTSRWKRSWRPLNTTVLLAERKGG
jgi:hypothetical protein